MKAIVLNSYGGPAAMTLSDRPVPACGPDQILIKVSHAGINPVDIRIRRGDLKLIIKLQLPHIVGCEVSGWVEAVGDNVTGFAKGDQVYTRLEKTRMGGFAEYVAEDAINVAQKPGNVTMEVAAGIPLVTLTAWQALHEYFQIQPGQKILIHAGAGAVGRVAIQLAKRAGAYVITTASPRGMDIVQTRGADQVINYREQTFEDELSGLDFVFDLVGGDTLTRSFRVLRPGGKLCTISGAPEPGTADDINAGTFLRVVFWAISLPQRKLAKKFGVGYRFLFMRPDGDQLRTFAQMSEASEIVFDIDRVFAMDDYKEAIEHLESGRALGKVILRVSEGA